MNQSSDILFMAEYIKNVLYFATVRQGKSLKSTVDTHYFCIDDELVYENYYSDFGPLNLGCVYRYCKILGEKISQYLNKQIIVHYTSIEPKKKANAAFLLGCYGVLYLSLTPRDALKPLLVQGQHYRPFQDVTQGDSVFTITIMDCLQAIKKARDLGFFNFQDFNFEEYSRLDKIHGGDLNWIIPGKFLAFIGPVDTRLSLFHPPEMYIDYFLDNNVKIVIRLNKRMYDGEVFTKAGILHYDLFFPDGSHPPRHIMFKFLQISEEAECAIAVHCKAGLGRTGSLIGSYLIKHYRMTSHEAIGWMRICRPGSVIGHQQAWLEKLEAWLIKQGNIYRKRMYQDTEKLPFHEYGIYSYAEKSARRRALILQKNLSPPPLRPRMSNLSSSPPENSRVKEDASVEDAEEEIYLASCDLTVAPVGPLKQMKGCVLTSTYEEERNLYSDQSKKKSRWRKYLCCRPCCRTFKDGLFMLAVRCASLYPEKCYSNKLCGLINLDSVLRGRPLSRTNQAPLRRSVDDARNYMRNVNFISNKVENGLKRNDTAASQTFTLHRPPVNAFNAAPKVQPLQNRRRLGRSPSPPAIPNFKEHNKATNTPVQPGKLIKKEVSKTALKDVFSRFTITPPEMGALLTKALRPIKSFNIENRAHRVISREKPTPAPKYPQNIEDLKRTLEADPNIDEKLNKKDPELDERLKEVYVISEGRPEDDVTREKQSKSQSRPLPMDRACPPNYDFGFKEPDKIPYGKTTLRDALNFITAHQSNPEEATVNKISAEYKLGVEDVENILKYFKTFEIYLPKTKTSQAQFIGPATMRKQLVGYKDDKDIKTIEMGDRVIDDEKLKKEQ